MSTNISAGKGTPKQPVPGIQIDGRGVVGDAHAGVWSRQVSLLSREIIGEFEAEMGRRIRPGEFAENITTSGLDLRQVACLDRLVTGEAELEVTQIGKVCHGDACAIFREVGKCVMPREGIFCRVTRGGRVQPEDRIDHTQRPMQVTVITVSDRASRGEYEDQSGPEVESAVRQFFAGTRWHLRVARRLLPDDAAALSRELEEQERAAADVVVLTGGTGIGPRDMTPEVVASFCRKMMPGVMEHIRLKYGADKPNALLSRSVAAVRGMMQVYAIPGSVRAAREYMAEILKTVEHALQMLHGIDAH